MLEIKVSFMLMQLIIFIVCIIYYTINSRPRNLSSPSFMGSGTRLQQAQVMVCFTKAISTPILQVVRWNSLGLKVWLSC